MNVKDIQLSKSLSWILRHGATKEGLQLSPEGYIAVDNILRHKTFHGKYNIGDIERVVASNDKQRFTLRTNPTTHALEIKANQGHSIKISDSELVPIHKPIYNTVVHGTYIKCWPQIKAEGLSRMKRLHIHLAKGIPGTVTSGARKNAEILIFINLKKALDGGIKFFESENGVILTPGDENGYLKPQYFFKAIVAATRYPPYTQPQDLIREFSQFGNLKIEKVTPNYALLTFKTAQEAQNAIKASGQINIYGEYLTIKQDSKLSPSHKGTKREFIRTKQKGMIVEPKEIDISGDFNNQVSQIVCTVRLTQDEANAISALYYDVERVLQAIWPGCVATPFGSITTGLGIKSSDADCFVLVPDRYQHGYANFVHKAKKILLSYPHIFAEILSIPRANTPIVKFFHIPTETNCDLSFKTPLGSQNSKLIAFLLHVDPRLIPMAILIKYWAKVHDLSGTGKLTNYALTMMIIFYLQQPPGILPSVAWLQMDSSTDYIVDYWNTGFMSKKELLPPSSNTLQLSDLLGGFFEYYSKFNFEELVVCPFLGTTIKKESFKDINQLPAVYERYKQNVTNGLVLPMRYHTAICVQDPFEQSHNVASGISNRFAEDIQAFFKFAATAYQEDKSKNCENFLKIILLQKPKIIRAKSSPEFRVHLFPRIIAHIVDPDWKSVLRNIIFTIFDKILKLKLNKVEEKKNQKSEESKKERERYTTVLVKSIWKRKQFARLYSLMHLNFVEKHTRITEEIMKTDKNNSETHFQLAVTYNVSPNSAVLSLKFLKGEGDAFREFGKFFTSIVQNWVTVLINPNAANSNTQQNVNIKETIEAIDHNLDTSNESDDTVELECDNGDLLNKGLKQNNISNNDSLSKHGDNVTAII